MGSEDEGLSIDKYFYSSVEDETYSDLLDFDDLLSAAPPPPLKRPCRAAASWLDGLANQEPVQKRQHQIQKQSQSFGLPFSQAYAPAQLDDAPRAFFGSESGVTQQAFRLPGPRGTFSVQEPFMVAMREGGGRVDDTTSPVGTGGGAVLSGRAADDPNDSFWKTLAGGLDPSWQDSLVPDPPAGSGGEELACDDGDHRDSLLRQLGLLGGPLDNDVASPGQLAGSRSGDGCCCAKPGSEAVLMDLTGAANRRLPPPPCQGSCACKDCELLAEVRLEWQHPQTSGPQVAGPRTYSCQLHGRHSHSGEGSHDLGSHSCVPAGGHKVAMDDAIALINHADGTVPGGTGTSEQDVFMPEPDLEGYEEEATVDPEFEERQVALEEPNASFDYSPRVSTSRHSSGSLDVPSSRGMGRDRRTLYHRTQSDGALPTSKSTTTLATTATTSTHPPMAEGTRGWQSLSALPPPAAPPAAAAAAVAPMPAAAPAPKQAASGSSSGGSDHNGSGRGQNGSGDGGGSKARPLFGASQSDRGDSLARRLADAMGIPFDPLPKSTSAPGPAPSAASAPLPPGALPAVSFVEAPLAQQRQQQHAVGGRHKPSSASLPELVQHGQVAAPPPSSPPTLLSPVDSSPSSATEGPAPPPAAPHRHHNAAAAAALPGGMKVPLRQGHPPSVPKLSIGQLPAVPSSEPAPLESRQPHLTGQRNPPTSHAAPPGPSISGRPAPHASLHSRQSVKKAARAPASAPHGSRAAGKGTRTGAGSATIILPTTAGAATTGPAWHVPGGDQPGSAGGTTGPMDPVTHHSAEQMTGVEGLSLQSDAATHAGYVAAAPGGSTSEMDVSAAGDQPSTAVVRATAGAMKCVECTPLDLMLRRDLSALAEAIATDDQQAVSSLKAALKEHASPVGTAMQRVAHYFVEALCARIQGIGALRWSLPLLSPPEEFEECMGEFTKHLPYRDFMTSIVNATFVEESLGMPSVHVLDLGVWHTGQWPDFMRLLAAQPGPPPKLRITKLEAPLNCTPARLPRLNVRDTRRYLVAAAAEVGLPFEYTSLETRLETLRPEMLGLRAGEALLVNGAMRFHTLTDGSVVRSSPRDAALRAIRQLEPRALVLGEKHVDQNGPFFLRRFSESLNFYSAVFDSIDAGMPAASAARHLFEKNVLGRDILNVVACEGLQRVARSEPLERWQERMRSAGFVAVPVKPGARAQLASTLEQYPHEGWSIQEEDKGALILCWKGRPIVATSIWRPAC